MTTWKERRAHLERVYITADVETRFAISDALARLDAAERAIEEMRGTRHRMYAYPVTDAYDALVREQDGGEP